MCFYFRYDLSLPITSISVEQNNDRSENNELLVWASKTVFQNNQQSSSTFKLSHLGHHHQSCFPSYAKFGEYYIYKRLLD